MRDLFIHWKSRFCGHWAEGGEGRGTELNGFLCFERKKERIFISQPQHDRYYCTWFITNIVNSYLHQREKNTSSYYLQTRLGWEVRHAIGRGGHRIQKARYHWPWSVGAGVVGMVGGGMGTGSEREGGGVFFTADLCWHLSHWRFSKVCILLIVHKKSNNFKILKFQIKIKTYKGCFLSIIVNKFRIFIKNLRNTYGLHFTYS